MGYRARLVMTLTLVAAAVALATSVANGVLFVRARVAAVRDQAHLSAREVYAQVDRTIRQRWTGDLASTLADDAALRAQIDALVGNSPITLYVAVTDADGIAVLHSDARLQGNEVPAAWSLASFAEANPVSQLVALARGAETFTSEIRFSANQKPLGEVRIGVSALLLRRELLGATLRQAGTASVIVLAAFLASVLIVGRLLAPIERLRLELSRLDPGEGHPRFDQRTLGDVERISRFFSTLGESLIAGRRRAQAGDGSQAEAIGRVASAAAHQMRTPLNTMVMHLAMLREEVDGAGRERIDILEGEIRRLDNVVKGFLRLSRAGDGAFESIPPATVLREVLVRVGPRAQAAGVRLESAIGEALPRVQGNAELLGEALLNLLSNAFDATPAGGRVVLTARRVGTGGLEVVVEDSGGGIPAEALPRVFDPYFTTKKHGTGIGLPLVKRIAELHGGDVSVASGEGGGTRVTLSFPAVEG